MPIGIAMYALHFHGATFVETAVYPYTHLLFNKLYHYPNMVMMLSISVIRR